MLLSIPLLHSAGLMAVWLGTSDHGNTTVQSMHGILYIAI